MSIGELTVSIRKENGKSPTRRLRQSGQVPGICYGIGAEPMPIAFYTKALQAALDPVKGRNTLLRMQIEGVPGGTKQVSVLLKDTQNHILRGELIHADFIVVSPERPVTVTVPVHFQGKSKGVADGGTLHLEYRKLPLLCLPGQIPSHIDVDVSGLDMGESLHVSDVQWPVGVTPALAPETTLCVVTAPKEEKAATAAAPVEGAPAADAAKKPAAGDAVADKAKAGAAKGK